ncbi:type VII secretion protein EccE [Amycolatopsis nigrescens]|uniref:type VII secretion protein EccE n=1 Tax=Amycolatopsis nigrescens TaxID=381445 RepID=UPI000381DB87|nr:type VII secretion protein EccE [Amycolatopsis nigrescens]
MSITTPDRPGLPIPGAPGTTATARGRHPRPAIWELAGIAALLLFAVGPPLRGVVAVLAVLTAALVTTVSLRFGGRSPTGWALTWIGYRLRRHDDRLDAPDPLHTVAGTVRVHRHVDRFGTEFGVAEVAGGWTAVLRLTAPADPDIGLLLDALRVAHRDPDIPLGSAQLVVRTMPQGRDGRPSRMYWLAVRYRPEQAPIAALARGGGQLGALRSTARAAVGLIGTLADAGCQSTVLGVGELNDGLRLVLGAGERAEVAHGWHGWSAGGDLQSCYAPRAGTDPAAALAVDVARAAFTVTSFTLRRTPAGKVRGDTVIRIAGGDAAGLGVPVIPLHGRHADYVRRSLPLALDF